MDEVFKPIDSNVAAHVKKVDVQVCECVASGNSVCDDLLYTLDISFSIRHQLLYIFLEYELLFSGNSKHP